MGRTFVVGDCHGQFDKLVTLLRAAQLVDESLTWTGADATLCFMGDFCDRGPDGIGCIDLVMRLQVEAYLAQGRVLALLGNHEPLILAARRFGNHWFEGLDSTFWETWKRNGGMNNDIQRLTEEHVDWLSTLPAMQQVGNWLLVHADALFYEHYGQSISEVNQSIEAILKSDQPLPWDKLLADYSERLAFLGEDGQGALRAQQFLQKFGGSHLVHGHTPIAYMTQQATNEINEAFYYANHLCLNVDGGMYMGGCGFVCELPFES